jgi:hypothetical protein
VAGRESSLAQSAEVISTISELCKLVIPEVVRLSQKFIATIAGQWVIGV